MNRSPHSSGLLPMPGSTSASWAVYRSRLVSVFRGVDSSVLIAFWLFGLINNVLYVIILSAAQDLVGTNVPKGVVLLADVLPSFLTKLVAPYFIHRIPYYARILIFVALSSSGMLLVALTPAERGVAARLVGVVLASLSSGGGELSFLGLTHYYGPMSLAAWGSGTGGAGLAGAGLYVAMTQWFGLTVKTSLLASALLPGVMVVSFFVILPRALLKEGQAAGVKAYSALPDRDLEDEDVEGMSAGDASASLLAPGPPGVASTALHAVDAEGGGHGAAAARGAAAKPTLARNLHRAKSLFIPYMLPLLLVYVAEYTINQGVSPTLLFPLEQSPFTEFRSFYPFYGFLYQLGVFVSRSSTPFYRVHNLYLPSLLQVANLVLLTLHAVLDFIPSVYLVFAVVFWEGLLGGAVYVNTFAEIMENVPAADREFSLGATSVSDSGGICLASLIGMVLEVSLCDYQVRNGRDWCRRIEAS
ncbi:battenin CLN3 protein [Pyricularia oryzae]|uniref:Protein BTN n=1 Tax=Pyricularia oryzae TaxID=318829 RepID=A0A4P7NH22_PYROR|nr:battenin CLN3 protein [Pyricularia oryzae]KAI6305118.1 battenin CLN3 protein [Pyricularia oryzae]KAI6510367.1 battenin CLN3 protein [Pyricularia oryzae]KAI6520991.1 battenin CLN3 protein [Pyricularia oryzae]KAI6538211.1 battenin CLN3 protein [Pyricularia oryzae]